MENVQLKPCPFCKDGGKPILEPQGTDAAVHCYKCDARGPIIDNGHHHNSPEWEERAKVIGAEAAAAWNAQAEAKDAWRPIETAPKDGTTVDLIDKYGTRYPDAHWDRNKNAWVDWVSDEFSQTYAAINAPITHWMSLPAAPSNDNGDK